MKGRAEDTLEDFRITFSYVTRELNKSRIHRRCGEECLPADLSEFLESPAASEVDAKRTPRISRTDSLCKFKLCKKDCAFNPFHAD